MEFTNCNGDTSSEQKCNTEDCKIACNMQESNSVNGINSSCDNSLPKLSVHTNKNSEILDADEEKNDSEKNTTLEAVKVFKEDTCDSSESSDKNGQIITSKSNKLEEQTEMEMMEEKEKIQIDEEKTCEQKISSEKESDKECNIDEESHQSSTSQSSKVDMAESKETNAIANSSSNIKSCTSEDNSLELESSKTGKQDDTDDSSLTISVSNNDNINVTVNEKVNNEISNENSDKNSENREKFSAILKDAGFPPTLSGVLKVGKYIPVKGDFTLRSNEALIESPSLTVPFLLKEQDNFPTKLDKNESRHGDVPKGFFTSSVGEFFMSLGLSRVNEWVFKDLTKAKLRQIKKVGKKQEFEKDLEVFQNNYMKAKKANEPFTSPLHKCEICDFVTDSATVMEGHLLIPHITPRKEFRCSYCLHITRDAREILFHMEALHSKFGRIEPFPQLYQCPFCPFEKNSKVKLTTHLNKCQKYFDRFTNLSPPRDFEYPSLTPKPITVSVVKFYEKSMNPALRARGRPKKFDGLPDNYQPHTPSIAPTLTRPLGHNPNIPLYRQLATSTLTDTLNAHQNSVQSCSRLPPPLHLPPSSVAIRPRHPVLSQICASPPQLQIPPTNRIFQVVSSTGQVLPLLGNSHLVSSGASQFSLLPTSVDSSLCQKKLPNPPSSQSVTFYTNRFGGGLMSHSSNQPIKCTTNVKMTLPPKLQGPYPPQNSKPQIPSVTPVSPNSLVVCEICDGYIKDLEQLRTHMQLIHRVKIHPKMLASRPPLNCQKCQWRFFTDQGLERHLLGAHGLVTSNMQDLANKNQDAGCCVVCGRVYASKLVAHMSQVHKVTLKPAHLSYKCTVCSATFGLYKLFENHVYLVHSGAVKRPGEEEDSPSVPIKKPNISKESDTGENDIKSTKCSSEETSKDDEEIIKVSKCKDCGSETSDIMSHIKEKHIKKCSVKLCWIEKCEKCLYSSSDGMLVLRMSDFGLEEEKFSSCEDTDASSDAENTNEEKIDNHSEITNDEKPSNSKTEKDDDIDNVRDKKSENLESEDRKKVDSKCNKNSASESEMECEKLSDTSKVTNKTFENKTNRKSYDSANDSVK